MNLKNYLKIDGYQLSRFEDMYRRYKLMYLDPENCSPMFIINTPAENLPTWEEIIADPAVMLKYKLEVLKPHLEIEDDFVPAVRVEFGTAQIAAAFGCEMFIPPNNLPCAGNHVLKNAQDVYKMSKPDLNAGWYGKVKDYTEFFLENLHEGLHIQHPDIQSTFNSAHLIRGNDIFTDFYDDPEALDYLLDLVTDYMIDLVPYLKNMIRYDDEWFFDWGAMWKGTARISNCSMHMISPKFYTEHILPRDVKLMNAIGGGRVHYCGTSGEVINEFIKNPSITGLDYDGNHHNLWTLSDLVPKNFTLLQWSDPPEGQNYTIDRLLKGDWPRKRNIILQVNASSIAEGKELLRKLRQSIPQ
jgi:Uroporphyrinogen-III decarboxylase